MEKDYRLNLLSGLRKAGELAAFGSAVAALTFVSACKMKKEAPPAPEAKVGEPPQKVEAKTEGVWKPWSEVSGGGIQDTYDLEKVKSYYPRAVKITDSQEPAIPHPQQQKEAETKLQALEKKFGKKPNVLIILLDDVGWGDFGVYGGGVAVGSPTPNINRLAHEGLQLTSTYSQPTCSPTRATINTGQLPIHHGILRPPMYGEPGGLAGAVTAAAVLSKNGYVTAQVGKWHQGESEGSQPQNVGFDEFFGFLSVSDMYTEWRDPYFYPEVVFSPERTKMVRQSNFCKDLVKAKRNGKIEKVKEITIPVSQELDEDFLTYSQDFIRRMAKGNRPFYLNHSTRGCHFDNYPSEKFQGKSPAMQRYKDCVVEMDYVVGKLIKTLEETGQLENTLVFITSDNGPEEDITRDYGHTPFRGSKGSTWEGGVRVPGIAYWKGVIKAGRVSDGLFDLADLFNTSIALGGGQIPTDRYIDGIDQTSFLLADNGESNRESIIYFLKEKLAAIRVGEYKVHRVTTEVPPGSHAQEGGLSGVTQEYTYGLTFNLYLDPKEERNLTIRKLVMVRPPTLEMDRYIRVLKKYPPSKNLFQ